MPSPPITDAAINDFAIRSFRNVADGDYIAARMACRAVLLPQFLWASQQAIEKYLKCILLLNRIPAKKVLHDLAAALREVNNSGKLTLDVTEPTRKFIERVDDMGRFRYLEVSHWGEAAWLVSLDRAVWELRRFCTLSPGPRRAKLVEGRTAPRIRLQGGHLEKILDSEMSTWSRTMLVWQNAFFGPRIRRTVRPGGWMQSTNAPLPLRPEIFHEVDKYVHLPREVREYWLKVLRGASP
jgi:HEPN domain-containing protein